MPATSDLFLCLVLRFQVAGFPAGLAVVLAVLAQAYLVQALAEHAVALALALPLGKVTDRANEILGHIGGEYRDSTRLAMAKGNVGLPESPELPNIARIEKPHAILALFGKLGNSGNHDCGSIPPGSPSLTPAKRGC